MKLFVWLLISVLIVNIASANLVINPNPQSMLMKQNEEKTFTATFTNNHNFKILDFRFTNLSQFKFPTDFSLNANESKTMQFKVKYPNSGTYTAQARVSYKYLVDLPEGQHTYRVNITEQGFNPETLVIRQGDTVIWRNNDQITRTVTSSYFDFEVSPSQEGQYIFNTPGQVNYQDMILWYPGTIIVMNATQEEKVNDPKNDVNWNFNIEITLDPTTLQITTNEANYTIDATGSKEGTMEVMNKGNMTAQKVKLISDPDWVKFSENEFDIAVGEKNYLTYTIEPKVFSTEETNKTYTIAVRAKGSNTEQVTRALNIKIPFSDVFENIQSTEGFLNFYIKFCESNPTLLICNNTISQPKNNSQVIIRDPTIPINFTATQVLDMLKRIQRMEDASARTTNELKQTNLILNTDVPRLYGMINETYSLQLKTEKEKRTNTSIIAWSILVLIIIGSILFILITARKAKIKKSLQEGGYTIES